MKIVENYELKNVTGGVNIVLVTAIVTGIVFLSGVITGIVNPTRCNE